MQYARVYCFPKSHGLQTPLLKIVFPRIPAGGCPSTEVKERRPASGFYMASLSLRLRRNFRKSIQALNGVCGPAPYERIGNLNVLLEPWQNMWLRSWLSHPCPTCHRSLAGVACEPGFLLIRLSTFVHGTADIDRLLASILTRDRHDAQQQFLDLRAPDHLLSQKVSWQDAIGRDLRLSWSSIQRGGGIPKTPHEPALLFLLVTISASQIPQRLNYHAIE